MTDALLALAIVAAVAAVTVVGTRIALRADASARAEGASRADDNVMTAAIRLCGAAFVFLAAFTGVSQWQAQAEREALTRAEFAALGNLAAQLPSDAAGMRVRASLDEYAEAFARDPLTPASGAGEMATAMGASGGMRASMGGSAAELAVSDAEASLREARIKRLGLPDRNVPWPVMAAVTVLGFTTLVIAACYPRGPSRPLKVLQSTGSAVVVGVILLTLVALQSPALEAARLAPIARGYLAWTGLG